jgi:integrase/recombinase XerC/integrase/recombinase XerD
MQKIEGFDLLVKTYLEYQDVKTISKQTYGSILRQFIDYVNTLSDLPTRSDIMAYREHLYKRNLESSTIKMHLGVIRNFYRWFYVEGYGSNPAEGIKSPKIEKRFKRSHLSEIESIKLLTYAHKRSSESIIDYRNYTMVSLMITTGLRTIEVERADIADLNELDDGHVLYIMGKGKDSKNSIIRLSSQVYHLIETYIMKRSDNHAPLFINHHGIHYGERLRTRNIRYIVKEMLRDIGIDSKKHTAHSLRHTTANLAIKNGADKDATQKLLRHADPATTEIYVHADTEGKVKYEYKISNVLFEGLEDSKKEE